MARPRNFDNVEDLENQIEKYFNICTDLGEPVTKQGLAYYLGFKTTESLFSYYGKADGYEMFFDTVKKAELRCEADMIKAALMNKYNPAVSIFLLKSNYGHSDKPNNSDDDKNININIQYPPEAK